MQLRAAVCYRLVQRDKRRWSGRAGFEGSNRRGQIARRLKRYLQGRLLSCLHVEAQIIVIVVNAFRKTLIAELADRRLRLYYDARSSILSFLA
jgi:hypothetical protein